VLFALSDSISLFKSPSEIVSNPPPPTARIRLGGMVEEGTLVKESDGRVRFGVSDGAASVKVAYQGLLPDLFREGQGVVAEGTMLADGTFRADTILAKHDETYMPREVVDALKAEGRWQEGSGQASAKPGAVR
jgi:cytochrome c-type biogenesis protein CcmE